MAKLEYSDSALKVLNKFYGVEHLVYVEGNDDIWFWEELFKQLSETSVKAIPVNGRQALQTYVDKIQRGVIFDIVAWDGDFEYFSNTSTVHPLILNTYGHSIEVTLFTKEALHRIITIYGRVSADQITREDCSRWLEGFIADCSILVSAEIVNYLNDSGLKILGNNCARFMDSTNPSQINIQEVSLFIDSLDLNLSPQVKAGVTRRLNSIGREIGDFIRGHFLFSAVVRYMNRIYDNLNLSRAVTYDGVYASAILVLGATMGPNHPHYEHYDSIITNALLYLKDH